MVSGDSQQIEKVKSIVKNMLIDGESAQFTDLKYYKATNFACGFVNAKNKMGGYVGKKKFIASLDQNAANIDPDRDLPKAPSAPSYVSLETTMNYAQESAAWSIKVREMQSEYMAFDALVDEKCTDTPPKEEKKVAIKKEESSNSISAFDIGVERIPPDFKSVNLESVANKVKELTKSKGEIETTDEYNKRMAVLTYDPSPAKFDTLYAFKIHTAPFDAQENSSYNADTEIVSVSFTGALTNGLCRDDGVKAEHPMKCTAGNGVELSISTKNKAFSKYFKVRKPLSFSSDVEYDLVDNFKLPRNKIAELPPRYSTLENKGIIVAALLIGSLVDGQKNPLQAGSHAVRGAVIPFNLKHIIYYNEKNGEILAKRDVPQ